MDTETSAREAPAGFVLGPTAAQDLVLSSLAIFLFVSNLAISFLFPESRVWQNNRMDGYLLHLAYTVLPVNMLIGPVALVIQPAAYWTWLGAYLGLAAWVVVAGVMKFGAPVPVWRRAIYAYLLAAQVSNYAAVTWSTLGN